MPGRRCSRRSRLAAKDRGDDQVEPLVSVNVPPAQAMNARYVGDRYQLPGIVQADSLHGHQQLAGRRRVHRELVGDRDLGLAVAVEVRRRARDDPGRLFPVLTIRFFQVGFSYQAQVSPPTAMTSGRLSPLTSATST